jgi:hypothetical protein
MPQNDTTDDLLGWTNDAFLYSFIRIQVKLSEVFQFSSYFKEMSGLLLKPESEVWKMISTNVEMGAVDNL